MKCRLLMALGVVYLAVGVVGGTAWGQGVLVDTPFTLRRPDGSFYGTSKLGYLYTYTAGGPTTCHGGVPWCIRTVCCGHRLEHIHYTENFTMPERPDAARFSQARHAQSTDVGPPTTAFNCYAHALYGRSNVWLNDPVAALGDDFVAVAGNVSDLYQIGHVAVFQTDHAAKVYELNSLGGYPWDAVKSVAEKRGGYGKYITPCHDGCPEACGYGTVTGVYRPVWLGP